MEIEPRGRSDWSQFATTLAFAFYVCGFLAIGTLAVSGLMLLP